MILADLCTLLEQIAPLHLGEAWDNNGLLVGDPSADVARVLLTIDLSDAVLDEAIAASAQLVLCYHPPIFKPLRKLHAGQRGPGGRIYRAIHENIALYAMHTTLDSARDGANDVLAELLGLVATRPLAPFWSRGRKDAGPEKAYKLVTFVPAEAADRVADAIFDAGGGQIGDYSRCSFRLDGTGTFLGDASTNPTVGQAGRFERAEEVRLEIVLPADRAPAAVAAMRQAHPYEEVPFDLHPLAELDERVGLGRIGPLREPATLDQCVERIKRGLGVEAIWLAEPAKPAGPIELAACCAGSCGELFARAIAGGAKLYLTGELRHHDALAAAEAGMAVAMVRHSVSERATLTHLAERIARAQPQLDLRVSQIDADPFRWA